jgi:hypothetical protein
MSWEDELYKLNLGIELVPNLGRLNPQIRLSLKKEF